MENDAEHLFSDKIFLGSQVRYCVKDLPPRILTHVDYYHKCGRYFKEWLIKWAGSHLPTSRSGYGDLDKYVFERIVEIAKGWEAAGHKPPFSWVLLDRANHSADAPESDKHLPSPCWISLLVSIIRHRNFVCTWYEKLPGRNIKQNPWLRDEVVETAGHRHFIGVLQRLLEVLRGFSPNIEVRQSPLITLPSEVREIIYRYTLVQDKIIMLEPATKHHAALLCCCTQIREEASQLYYCGNNFKSEIKDYMFPGVKYFRLRMEKYPQPAGSPSRLSWFGKLMFPNWRNLLAWLKAHHEGKLPSAHLFSHPQLQLVLPAFDKVKELKEQPWPLVERQLAGVRADMAARDSRWSVLHDVAGTDLQSALCALLLCL